MKLHKFSNEAEYINKQIRGCRKHWNRRPTANEEEEKIICDYVKSQEIENPTIMCHGARCGTEIKLFEKFLPGANVKGTDVCIDKDDTGKVVQWDFHKQKSEWERAFDIVYSNTLDHSHSPSECVDVWIDQVKMTGYLALCWSFRHQLLDKEGTLLPGGDCYGAALHEYMELVEKKGIIEDLLWIPLGRHVIIMASPKG